MDMGNAIWTFELAHWNVLWTRAYDIGGFLLKLYVADRIIFV